jgi:hypothetical protein
MGKLRDARDFTRKPELRTEPLIATHETQEKNNNRHP